MVTIFQSEYSESFHSCETHFGRFCSLFAFQFTSVTGQSTSTASQNCETRTRVSSILYTRHIYTCTCSACDRYVIKIRKGNPLCAAPARIRSDGFWFTLCQSQEERKKSLSQTQDRGREKEHASCSRRVRNSLMFPGPKSIFCVTWPSRPVMQ